MTLFTFFTIAALICVVCVVVSLFWGLFAMTQGDPKDRKTSNKMMRMRVLFQGLAVLFLFLAFLAK
jgi:hypothetical protein